MSEAFLARLGRLAGSRQRENQLSRTFAACFEESPGFRQAVLALVWRATKRRGPMPGRDGWTCAVEQSLNGPRRGRVDLHLLGPSRPGGKSDQFFIESKVESDLARSQPLKYLQAGIRPLIVITKYLPDADVRSLASDQVFFLRWQDVHRALRVTKSRHLADRQIARWMIDYLEELEMAYREDLSARDLIECAHLFRRAAGSAQGWRQMAARGVFEAAHGVAGLMDDLRTDFVTRHPRFAKAPFGKTETFYAKHSENGGRSAHHHLGWEIHRRHWKTWQIACSIRWDDSAQGPLQAYFWISLQGTSIVPGYEEARPTAQFFRDKKLDRAKLLNRLENRLADWGVLKHGS
jgi:hypothetical protein